MLCICVCSSGFCFSANLIQNIDKFGTKKYFIDHWTYNAIQLFVPIKKRFFGSLLFQNKLQQRGILHGWLDKYSYLLICISLKWTLSSGLKPVYSVKISRIRTNSLCCSALLWTSFFFCRLINKSILEWFPLITYKWHTLTRSTNLFSWNHPIYFVFD